MPTGSAGPLVTSTTLLGQSDITRWTRREVYSRLLKLDLCLQEVHDVSRTLPAKPTIRTMKGCLMLTGIWRADRWAHDARMEFLNALTIH
jgi:hypothetical protein